MQLLDADERVESWSSESFSLPYTLDGKKKRYVPDFHVITRSGHDFLIEVKPLSLRETSMNVEKRNAAIEFCAKNGWFYVEWQPGDTLDFNDT